MKLVANCTSLVVLKLSNNEFHGEIFSKSFQFFNNSLRVLELINNLFRGTLLDMVSPAGSYLGILEISNNSFSGLIPKWLGNMQFGSFALLT